MEVEGCVAIQRLSIPVNGRTNEYGSVAIHFTLVRNQDCVLCVYLCTDHSLKRLYGFVVFSEVISTCCDMSSSSVITEALTCSYINSTHNSIACKNDQVK